MKYKTLIKTLEEIRWMGCLDKISEALFLYTLRRREANIPEKYIKLEIKQALEEVFDDELFEVREEKIRGVGCSGDYPYSRHDFLTPLAWRREEYEHQPEYRECFEE